MYIVHTYITLHYMTWHYITLHCIALHYITLYYNTIQCNKLQYNTKHTLHTSIHPSIHPSMHPCIHASMHACMQAYIHHHTSPYITVHHHTSPLHHHYITITLHYNTLHYVHTYTFNHINVTLHCIVLDFDMTVHSMCCSTFLHYNTKQCMKVYSYLKNMPMNKAGNKLVKRSNRSMRQCICKGNEQRHEAHKDARLGVNNHSIQEQTTTTYNSHRFGAITSHAAATQQLCRSRAHHYHITHLTYCLQLHPLCTLPPKPGPSIPSVLCTFRRLLSYLPPNWGMCCFRKRSAYTSPRPASCWLLSACTRSKKTNIAGYFASSEQHVSLSSPSC